MNSLDKDYKLLLQDVLDNGTRNENRTGIDTLSVFNRQVRINLEEGFPALTTKKIFIRGVFEETQFFLRGQTDTKILEAKGVNYWKGNTTREFLDNRGLYSLPEGDLGCGYSHQWRNYGGEHPSLPQTKGLKGVDQITRVFDQLRNNPSDRRIILLGWNPQQVDQMTLPCCHLYAQFYTNVKKKELSCFFVLRSNDLFLGLPTNILQYAFLTHYLAEAIGYKPRELVYTGVDAHIYTNHIEQVKEQLSREPRELPKLHIKQNLPSLEHIFELEWENIEIKGYYPHPAIKAEMAV